MIKLKPGDRVTCKLKNNTIINPYESDYDEFKSFDVIAIDDSGLYLYVPPFIYLKDFFKADSMFIKKLDLDRKYLNDSIIYIMERSVYKIKSQMDGVTCSKCKDFCYQAAANQENGSFICWSCRTNEYH